MVAKTAKSALLATHLTVAGVLLLALAGCRMTSEPGSSASPGTPIDTVGPVRTSVTPWPIDPQRSTVTIIVRRAGPLARFGHDHVITSADERGTVWVGDAPATSAFELQLPVGSFEVDLPEARASAGAEFAVPVPDDARAGTRRNMLRAEVLDAAAFPLITLRSLAASGDWSQPVLKVAVQLRGVSRAHEIPVQVECDALGLVVRGELRLNQSDYGITPFAVAGGAIQVADTLEIRFVIAAGPT
ncbi:MAG: YceI family protein [Steroidobacteraceae bacterium]